MRAGNAIYREFPTLTQSEGHGKVLALELTVGQQEALRLELERLLEEAGIAVRRPHIGHDERVLAWQKEQLRSSRALRSGAVHILSCAWTRKLTLGTK